jgi:PD-(D/E)XK nuclease superfamily
VTHHVRPAGGQPRSPRDRTDDEVNQAPTRAELEAASCWDPSDVIARRPVMTAFRQRTRLDQARWRTRHDLPIGSQPYAPRRGDDGRPVGSRIPLASGRETGANLVTEAALEAARGRMARVEPHQSIDHQRLWADLLSSEALTFNLFGDLAADLALADHLVRGWFPDAPGRVSDVRFLHSPGRLDPQWLNSLRQFDAAFVLDRDDGTQGIVAVDVAYHERLKPETPKPENLWRYQEVHERSEAFTPAAFDRVSGRSDLWSPWLEQLLLFSMLQHPDGAWTWGRFVIVHPVDNPDMADLCARYRGLLREPTTFRAATLEDVLVSGALPTGSVRSLRDRYGVPQPTSRTPRSGSRG